MVAELTQHCEQTLMFTDIVGYSRLMGRNESLAVEMLGDYRRILLSHIEGQGGQLVEFVGDAIFARFDTAASAVAAAIAIQQHLLAFNDARDKKLPRLQTRIGLHKGEVMLRDGAVFGDSVNIAARLEPLAVADGICISQTVYDEIRITLSSPAKRLGVQSLKNIEQKIRVYLIKPAGIGWRDHLHYFLRGLNKNFVTYRYPLTACLLAFIAAGVYFIPRWLVPGYAANYVEIADFQNLLNEKGDSDYFSAGITAAVRSQLADMRDVYIVDAKEGIHAPIRLEGSVQKLDDNLRISYRLFRRKDNVQIAGGKLDGKYQDIFILQDRLVGEIARYLADEFELQNFRPAPLRLTNNITAYDYYLRGFEYLNKSTSHESVDSAIQMFNAALVHDNQFSLANSGLCGAFSKKFKITNSVEWQNEAEQHCLMAVSQDSRSSYAYRVVGAIYRDTGRYEDAIRYLKKGLLIDNDPAVIVGLANVYDLMNEDEKAESLYLQAFTSDSKSWKIYDGYGYFLMRKGRYDEAIDNYKKVLDVLPDSMFSLNSIGSIYLYKNDFSSAAKYYELAAAIEPSVSIYANIGNMHYFIGEYGEASAWYKKALSLEPYDYQVMVYLGDAYKFISGGKELSNYYFNEAIIRALEEIKLNKNIARSYQYLARSYAALGDMDSAKKALLTSNGLDSASVEAVYANLRVAILGGNDGEIKYFSRALLDTEYSEKMMLVDPDLSVLKEGRFKDLFVSQK